MGLGRPTFMRWRVVSLLKVLHRTLIDFENRKYRPGDGMHYPLNPRAEEVLAKLAEDLVNADRDNN